ncbi:MAG: HAD family phosphatase [Syntrophobacterales bacterium]|nr:MAG: HAD family phosphatase [Syntrophobacterales bacterium]
MKLNMEHFSHYRLVIFDLDGTLTAERSIWEYIHRKLGKWDGYAEEYQNQFLQGKISYRQFCELDARVWKGMKVDQLRDIVRAVPFNPGIDELTSLLRELGLRLTLISSGLCLLSEWVEEKYGFDYGVSNRLLHEDGILTGEVEINVHYDQKAKWVRNIMDIFRVRGDEIISIGDSIGDMEMFEMAGYSISFNSSSPELNQIADVVINSNDLSHIIPGLPRIVPLHSENWLGEREGIKERW